MKMEIFMMVSLFFISGVNIFLLILLEKYRKMFLKQHENFLKMNDLVEFYKLETKKWSLKSPIKN